ncbi:hypothetical protein SCP_1104370 [Sparassis crispa]|uniref:DUF6589 domain-containing protein n=1 Tax=Sparassis crispa TaxID=139825 RepID=A0A401H035_9APHY|nr:hypothetical protein SCP_1104370 [Sparassis crispa]GBE87760.1 hypothetical protein SCP_1104370 [Sparassis crispa]
MQPSSVRQSPVTDTETTEEHPEAPTVSQPLEHGENVTNNTCNNELSTDIQSEPDTEDQPRDVFGPLLAPQLQPYAASPRGALLAHSTPYLPYILPPPLHYAYHGTAQAPYFSVPSTPSHLKSYLPSQFVTMVPPTAIPDTAIRGTRTTVNDIEDIFIKDLFSGIPISITGRSVAGWYNSLPVKERILLALRCLKRLGFSSIGEFFVQLFTPGHNTHQEVYQTIAAFLRKRSRPGTHPIDILRLIYNHKKSEVFEDGSAIPASFDSLPPYARSPSARFSPSVRVSEQAPVMFALLLTIAVNDWTRKKIQDCVEIRSQSVDSAQDDAMADIFEILEPEADESEDDAAADETLAMLKIRRDPWLLGADSSERIKSWGRRVKTKAPNFLILYDNVNKMSRAWQKMLAHSDEVHSGTAATLIKLEDVPMGALDLDPLLSNLLKKERLKITLKDLLDDIDWAHIRGVGAGHVLRIWLKYIPILSPRRDAVVKLFTESHKKRLLRLRKSEIESLRCSNIDESMTVGTFLLIRTRTKPRVFFPMIILLMRSLCSIHGIMTATRMSLPSHSSLKRSLPS